MVGELLDFRNRGCMCNNTNHMWRIRHVIYSCTDFRPNCWQNLTCTKNEQTQLVGISVKFLLIYLFIDTVNPTVEYYRRGINTVKNMCHNFLMRCKNKSTTCGIGQTACNIQKVPNSILRIFKLHKHLHGWALTYIYVVEYTRGLKHAARRHFSSGLQLHKA